MILERGGQREREIAFNDSPTDIPLACSTNQQRKQHKISLELIVKTTANDQKGILRRTISTRNIKLAFINGKAMKITKCG